MSEVPSTVAFIIPTMRRGGAERQTLAVMRRLDPTKWRPLLVTLDGRGPFFDAAVDDGIESVCLGVRGKLAVLPLVRLVRFLGTTCPKVVVTSGFSATTLGRIAAILVRTPVILVAEHSTGDFGRGLWARTVDASLAPFTSAFIAVCRSQLDYLWSQKGTPCRKTVVIYNGVETEDRSDSTRLTARRALGLSNDDFVVGIVATMRPEKDHATFMRAAAALSSEVSSARFVVVGDGPLRKQVERISADLGLNDSVVFTGDRDDVMSLLPAFDVFTLSSYTVETFPMSALEAMLCGVPVVATNVGGLPEMVREGREGLLVAPRSPEPLAAAWKRLADDPALRESMSRSATQRVECEFNATRMTRDHEALFSRLLSGGEPNAE